MKRKKVFTWLIIVLLIFSYYLYESYKTKRRDNDKYETTGRIIDYWISFPDSHYVKYEYYVDGKSYVITTSTEIVFPQYPETKDCFNKRFVVVCEKSHPENSKIYLNREVK